MPLRLRSAGGGSVQLNPPVATSTDVVMEVPAYDGAKVLTNKTPGAVLQVVQTSKTSAFTAAVALPSFTDITGLSATITPLFATSKILVIYSAYICASNSSGQYMTASRVTRNGSAINLGDARTGLTPATAGGGTPAYWYPSAHHSEFLDSPATTNTLTYQVQMGSEGGVASLVGGSYNTGNALGICTPSQITLMEIAG